MVNNFILKIDSQSVWPLHVSVQILNITLEVNALNNLTCGCSTGLWKYTGQYYRYCIWNICSWKIVLVRKSWPFFQWLKIYLREIILHSSQLFGNLEVNSIESFKIQMYAYCRICRPIFNIQTYKLILYLQA